MYNDTREYFIGSDADIRKYHDQLFQSAPGKTSSEKVGNLLRKVEKDFLKLKKTWKAKEKVYLKELKANPKSFEVCNKIAFLYADIGKDDLAIKYFKQLLKINPDRIYIYRGLGSYYLEICDNKKGMRYYRKYFKLYHSIASRNEIHFDYLHIADTARRNKNYNLAIEYYKKLLNWNYAFGADHFFIELANTYTERGNKTDYELALNCFSKCLINSINNSYLLFSIGFTYYKYLKEEHLLKRAIEFFKAAAVIEPSYKKGVIFYMIGCTYLKMNFYSIPMNYTIDEFNIENKFIELLNRAFSQHQNYWLEAVKNFKIAADYDNHEAIQIFKGNPGIIKFFNELLDKLESKELT